MQILCKRSIIIDTVQHTLWHNPVWRRYRCIFTATDNDAAIHIEPDPTETDLITIKILLSEYIINTQ